MSNEKLTWGILGTGRIAATFAQAVHESDTGELWAVASRTRTAAEAFAKKQVVPHAYDSYQAMLDEPRVNAVYISLPNHLHAPWSIRLAEIGKHILCEKPLAMNECEAQAVIEAAQRHDVFLMEAFMYRCHPQTSRMVELIRDGAIGQVRHVHVAFAYDAGPKHEDIRYINYMGGGGIMDVGCYCTSMARLIAGAAVGRDFSEPIELSGSAVIQPDHQVDDWAVAAARFPGDITATMICGMRVDIDCTLTVCGSEGQLFVPAPWFPNSDDVCIQIRASGQEHVEEIHVASESSLYRIEADTVARYVDARQAAPPAMCWDDSLGNLKTLDQWRACVGLQFPADRLDGIEPRKKERRDDP